MAVFPLTESFTSQYSSRPEGQSPSPAAVLPFQYIPAREQVRFPGGEQEAQDPHMEMLSHYNSLLFQPWPFDKTLWYLVVRTSPKNSRNVSPESHPHRQWP